MVTRLPGSVGSAVGQAGRGAHVLSPQHVAQLGAELFGRHGIAVEVAGTLLLAAVVGAAVIVAHGPNKNRTLGNSGPPRQPGSTEASR